MSLTRRSFIRRSAAGSLAALAFPSIVRSLNANSQLQVGVIGANGQGLSDLNEIGSHTKVQFVGFCDVDAARVAKAQEKFPGIPHFQDFREMFSKLGDTLDAVQVSTPDHTHALISLGAMRRGKHVYCQKPLTHTVWESRQMRLQAEKSGVITQMGNQIHSATEYRTGVKLIRDGAIGRITAVHSWIGNRGNQFTGLTGLPPSAPVPETLSWEIWVGPAPMRDYANDVYHPFQWRDWQDFGSGALGDFGCHVLDPVFSALELTAPLSLRAENDGLNPQTWPSAETVEYIFPGTSFTAGKTIPLTWHDGGRRPDIALAKMPDDAKLPGGGSLFIGEAGTMVLPHVGMPQLYPKEKFADYKIEKVPGASHYHLWVDAVIAGKKTSDGFHYAGPLSETVQLGNVATRLPGEKLEWDAAALRFSNKPDAARLLTRQYREGWKIEPVA
jgi:predicted dehydrogenase